MARPADTAERIAQALSTVSTETRDSVRQTETQELELQRGTRVEEI